MIGCKAVGWLTHAHHWLAGGAFFFAFAALITFRLRCGGLCFLYRPRQATVAGMMNRPTRIKLIPFALRFTHIHTHADAL